MILFDLSSSEDNAALKDIIAGRIRREGPISFRAFMELALYHPVHGYYLTCEPQRDYQSSPNTHPIFGACLARQLAEAWRLLGSPARFDVLECGAGSGVLAGAVCRWLRAREPAAFDALRYSLQDVTYAGERGARVFETLGLPRERISVRADGPAPFEIEGCIISNELLDAFPVHRVRVAQGRLLELRVGLEGERFVEVTAEAAPEVTCYFQRLGLLPAEGCEAEVNLEAPRWVSGAAQALKRGYLITLDYGYEADELYAPWRKRGTLLTFYRHTVSDDPFVRVGRQDITASVDFTSIARAGVEAGLETLGITTQAEFLSALGLGETVAERPQASQLEAYYALRRGAIELTDTAGLGRIKVLVQGKSVPSTPLRGLDGAGGRRRA